ncbi:MAG: hypothetical protein EAZ42_06325 [Verrucomicrobia bacterium]|nr:MAG: hypothetical protein EAZ42_06325 [Verrucomicrobiota bacterium]
MRGEIRPYQDNSLVSSMILILTRLLCSVAQWRAEKASNICSSSASQEPAFFTGKPYLESSSGYAYKILQLQPRLEIWKLL